MKNKLYLVLILLLLLLLCACKKDDAEENCTIYNTTLSTSAETVCAATEPTMQLHSELYHPGYTPQQIREYFEEVVLHVEYSSGTGDAALIQKWLSPIHYRISGAPTEADLAVLERFFEQLNQIPGFPGIQEVPEGEPEQLRIGFLEPDIFRASYSSVVGGEDATGAAEFWYYTNTNEVHSARIGYRIDLAQDVRNSILLEEIVNVLGISDTVLRADSITYQYSDDNTALSDVDWILLYLLYHPDMQCGMDAENCAAVLRRLYY